MRHPHDHADWSYTMRENKIFATIMTVLLAFGICLGTLSLTACGGDKRAVEQADCYGDDLPKVND